MTQVPSNRLAFGQKRWHDSPSLAPLRPRKSRSKRVIPILHDLAILECMHLGLRVDGEDSGYRTIEIHANELSRIRAVFGSMGHLTSTDRVERRFRNGLRFFVQMAGDEAIASTWIIRGGDRYLDEVNWLLPVSETEIWIRDIYVKPSWRGKGVFGALIASLARLQVRPCTSIWSDVDWSNRSSMRAHLAVGFEIRARVRALEFLGFFRIRGAVPTLGKTVVELEPGRRLVLLTGSLLKRHQELIA